MNNFTYPYPTKVYFGQDAVKKVYDEELSKVGNKVMLAYGSGSVKKNGIYEEMVSLLKKAGSVQAVLDGDIWELEYSKGRFPTSGILMGAVVTASGTGAEMNQGAVDWIRQYKLPTRMSDLKSTVVITPEVLRKVADTSNLIKTGPVN